MYCSHCGKPNPDDYRFCSSCGKPRSAETSQSSPSQNPEQAVDKFMDVLTKKARTPISKELHEKLWVDLANVVLESVIQDKLSEQESRDASGYVLENLDKNTNVASLESFLIMLKLRWNIFDDICNAYLEKLRQ